MYLVHKNCQGQDQGNECLTLPFLLPFSFSLLFSCSLLFVSFSYWITSLPLQTIFHLISENWAWRTRSCQKMSTPEIATWKSHREESGQGRELLERQFHRCPYSIHSNCHLVPWTVYPLNMKRTPTDVVLKTRHFLILNNLEGKDEDILISFRDNTIQHLCLYGLCSFLASRQGPEEPLSPRQKS